MLTFPVFLALALCLSLTSAAKDDYWPDYESNTKFLEPHEKIDWSKAVFDPSTADTNDDAVWNCIYEFEKHEPRWACNPTRAIQDEYARRCTMNGNVGRLRYNVYKLCDDRAKFGREGLKRRPCLKCLEREKEKEKVVAVTVTATVTAIPAAITEEDCCCC